MCFMDAKTDSNNEQKTKAGFTAVEVHASDVLGLGKGVEKLIDVCARAIGCVYRPFSIKNDADAKSYAASRIGSAIAQIGGQLQEAKYAEAGLSLIAAKPEPLLVEASSPIGDRAQKRLEYQKIKEQQNIEDVVASAAEELKNEKEPSAKNVDEDWATRFFKDVGSVSNPEMQKIWAKLLAGEVRQPGSFSLRTLEVVKNLSQKEALLFERLTSFAIGFVGDRYILRNIDYLQKAASIYTRDIIELESAGLLHHNDSLSATLDVLNADEAVHLFYGNKIIFLKANPNVKKVLFPCIPFTSVGIELSNLIPISASVEYITEICKSIKAQTKEWHHADFVDNGNGTLRFFNKAPVPGMT